MAAYPRNIRAFGPLDAVVAVLLTLVAVVFVPFARARGPCTLVVYRDNRVVARYPLGTDTEFTLQGVMGPFSIRIEHETARVIRSHCPKRLCMASGSIAAPGRQIVCAPNHLLMLIECPSCEVPDAVAE